MIGRGAIRSPWLFEQIRQELRGEAITQPTGRDVWGYIRALWASQASFDKPEQVQCDRMKKFLNFLGEGVPAPFLHEIRRAAHRRRVPPHLRRVPRPRRADAARADRRDRRAAAR